MKPHDSHIMDFSRNVNNRVLLALIFNILFVACAWNVGSAQSSHDSAAIPNTWIDSSTGHTIVRLSRREGDNTSFYFHNNPFIRSTDGTIDWYNLLRGLVGKTGVPYINPVTQTATKFVLSGDPVRGTGWIDGTIAGPGDRRFALCSGPFTMVPGVSDTQEVVVGNLEDRGANYLASVTALKLSTQSLQSIFRMYLTSNDVTWGGKKYIILFPKIFHSARTIPTLSM